MAGEATSSHAIMFLYVYVKYKKTHRERSFSEINMLLNSVVSRLHLVCFA